jgi:hypothetical protein
MNNLRLNRSAAESAEGLTAKAERRGEERQELSAEDYHANAGGPNN